MNDEIKLMTVVSLALLLLIIIVYAILFQRREALRFRDIKTQDGAIIMASILIGLATKMVVFFFFYEKEVALTFLAFSVFPIATGMKFLLLYPLFRTTTDDKELSLYRWIKKKKNDNRISDLTGNDNYQYVICPNKHLRILPRQECYLMVQ
jgi:hypothetical protein